MSIQCCRNIFLVRALTLCRELGMQYRIVCNIELGMPRVRTSTGDTSNWFINFNQSNLGNWGADKPKLVPMTLRTLWDQVNAQTGPEPCAHVILMHPGW
jgi:hypothetical protein